jgi:hypothetical protein
MFKWNIRNIYNKENFCIPRTKHDGIWFVAAMDRPVLIDVF